MINIQREISFPYKVSSKVLVVGGHESWYREFKQLVDGKINYIPRNKPGYRSASVNKYDFVVVQVNALSHANFYKLQGICKSKGIPMEYFSQSSAKKCVCELAEFDHSYAA